VRTPKKDRSVNLYLLEIKKIVDTLSAIGYPISTDDHIEAILDGLSEDYDGFVTAVLSRTDPYTVEEIEALLLSQEERFDKHKSVEQIHLRLILLWDLGFPIIIKTRRTSFLHYPLKVVVFKTKIFVVHIHRIIIEDLGIRELHGRIQNLNAKYAVKWVI